MSNTFRFNGKSYNADDVIHLNLKYRFINKNEPLTAGNLSKALGYSLGGIAWKFLLAVLGIFAFTLFVYNLIDFKLSTYEGLYFIDGYSDIRNILYALVTSFACSICLLFLVIPKVYDTLLIRRYLTKVVEARQSEIDELVKTEADFRKENGIENSITWSYTQHDKLSLLRVILLEDINSSSISRRSKSAGSVSERPELSQYIIID